MFRLENIFKHIYEFAIKLRMICEEHFGADVLASDHFLRSYRKKYIQFI